MFRFSAYSTISYELDNIYVIYFECKCVNQFYTFGKIERTNGGGFPVKEKTKLTINKIRRNCEKDEEKGENKSKCCEQL